jgi:hypothetical protein
MFEILNKRCAGSREAEDLSFKARREPTITGGESVPSAFEIASPRRLGYIEMSRAHGKETNFTVRSPAGLICED